MCVAYSLKLFDDVDESLGLPQSWTVIVRIDVKFPVEPRYRDKQHFILIDTTVSHYIAKNIVYT